jgi:hypothetical protein
MFFASVLVSGLLAGLMYALVAIGFVLIYKASGVFNFAQGTMVLFAALTFVILNEHVLPFWAAFPVTVVERASRSSLCPSWGRLGEWAGGGLGPGGRAGRARRRQRFLSRRRIRSALSRTGPRRHGSPTKFA